MKRRTSIVGLGCCLYLGSLLTGSLTAAVVEDVLVDARQHMDEAAWLELGSTAWAEAIEKSLSAFPDLNEGQRDLLSLHIAEAYLAARRIDMSEPLLKPLLEKELSTELRARLGQALILQWTHRWQTAADISTVISAAKMLHQHGAFPNLIQARAHVAEGARLLAMDQKKKSLIQYDAAIGLLREATAEERAVVYQLRLTAMEASGLRQSVIADWFEARRKDPAVKAMMSQMFSSAQSLQGEKLPFKNEALSLKCDDGKEHEINFLAIPGAARVLFVFASWSKGSSESAPVVASVLADYKGQVDLLAVSLDTEDSLQAVQVFRQRYGLEGLIIAEGTGWESQLAKALRVESIPAIIVVDKSGGIRAVDIHGANPQQTEKRLRQSLQEIIQESADVGNDHIENDLIENEDEDIP